MTCLIIITTWCISSRFNNLFNFFIFNNLITKFTMTSSCFSLGNAFYALERHIGITCIFDFWLVCQDESVQVHCDSDEIHTDLTPGCRLHLVEAQNPWETTDNYETPLVSRVRSHTFDYMGITNIASYSRSALLSARMPPPAVIPTIRSE